MLAWAFGNDKLGQSEIKLKMYIELENSFIFATTVPVQHTVRSASGSFFYIAMANKVPYSIADQISLLKQRGMLFKDEKTAQFFRTVRIRNVWGNSE